MHMYEKVAVHNLMGFILTHNCDSSKTYYNIEFIYSPCFNNIIHSHVGLIFCEVL